MMLISQKKTSNRSLSILVHLDCQEYDAREVPNHKMILHVSSLIFKMVFVFTLNACLSLSPI
jgi:hypothetical protein